MRRAHAVQKVVDERRALRYTVNISGTMANGTDPDTAVTVVDLSRRGFGAECADAVAVDSTIVLTLPGVCHAKARIRWVEAGRLGAEFLAPQRLFLIPEVIEQGGITNPSRF